MPEQTIETSEEEMHSANQYHVCPLCKRSLIGPMVPDYMIEAGFCGKKCHRCGGASHWSTAIVHHVLDGDKIAAINWMCPDCGGMWSSGA